MSEERNFDGLVLAIERTSADLGQHAKRAVNLCLTLRNWLIGRHIAEHELKGNDRSRYGERLLSELAKALTRKGVSSMSKRQLYGYLGFYRAYPEIVPTLSAQFTLDYKAPVVEKVPTLSALFQESAQSELLRLSYSHIREIVAVEDAQKRTFYEQHCLRTGWSVRELRRQIATLYYERTALSTNKAELEKQALEKAEREPLESPIRDPYVFEFLGLKPIDVMGESDLEDALLSKLQEFLLELGHGVKAPAALEKAILNALSERDESALVQCNSKGEPEPDPELRDYENVPLKEDIDAYMQREVLPHVPDAWVDHSKTKIGYEIPFTRHFYVYTPPRPLEVIEAEIRDLEAEIQGMLAEVLG